MADPIQTWPVDGGEMSSLIRNKDWSDTPLGPIEEWPSNLLLAVDICLSSKTEMSICWGEDLILLYNDAWKKLLGDKHPSALGLPARNVFEDQWQTLKPRFDQVLTARESAEVNDQKIPFSENGVSYFDLSFCPISNKNRSVGGILAIASEITRQKQVETEATELTFRQIFENIPGLYLVVKPETYEIVAASDAYLDATMTERADLMGQRLFEVFPAAPDDPQAEGVRRLRKSLKSVQTERRDDTMPVTRYPIPRPESEGGGFEERWWSTINSPVFNTAGDIDYIIHRVEDVTPVIRQLKTEGEQLDILQQLNADDSHLTAEILLRERDLQKAKELAYEQLRDQTVELKSYQDQLRSLASQLNHAEEQERRRLAAELHDNLGQLLTVCKMKVEGIDKSDLPQATTTEIVGLKELIDDALTYTRELMSELKPPPALDKEDVGEILSWVAQKMEKHGLNVRIRDDGQPKPLNEEIRTALYQCVRELLFNVVKHAEVNKATLVLSRLENRVRVTVEDDGKGFDMEGKPAPTEEGGFGLFNILERMDLLGGRLEIFSVPGKGTKATLYAPLKKEKQKGEPAKATEAIPAKDQSSVQTELWQELKVLLVDDHAMVRRGLREMIEEQDDMTIIAEASDGEEAVKLALEVAPDIVVMDVNMPVMDGIEATREITSNMPHVRIVGLSLHDQQKVADEMRNAGACAYLTKTEAFETLCATIRTEARKV